MIANSEFSHIDNKAIFFKRFHRSSFACTIAKFAKFFAYCFIGLHVSSMLLEAISPFSINPPDIFFQLLFLLILWGIVEFASIPIEGCADDCIFDYQHHWISFYQNRFFYNKTTIVANFNQLISIGITCRPKSLYSSLFKSSGKRYAIVIQDLSSQLTRITDYNLDLMEANHFCKSFCETHLPGTKFYEGEKGMELVLDPETGAISFSPTKSSTLSLIDSITVPTFQAFIGIMLTYIVFNASFYFINFSSELIFNTDIRISNQPVMQLINGLENVKQEEIQIDLANSPESSKEKSFVKVKVSVPSNDKPESTSFPTLDLKNQKVIITQTIASSSDMNNNDVSTANTEINYIASVTNIVKKILLPFLNTEPNEEIKDQNEQPLKVDENIVQYNKNMSLVKENHINNLHTSNTQYKEYNEKTTLINSTMPSFEDEKTLPQNISQPVKENTIPAIDISIISQNSMNLNSEENSVKASSNTDKMSTLRNSIPSIEISQLPETSNTVETDILGSKLSSPNEGTIDDENTIIQKQNHSAKEAINKAKNPIKTMDLLKVRANKSLKSSFIANNDASAILPGYGLGKLASLQELAATCITRLGAPLIKYRAKNSWQLIYSDFTLITTIKKLEQIQSITITRKHSSTHGLIETPQGVSVGSPVSLVAEKYGPSTLLDGSPSLHFPSLGITFIPSGTNDKIVGAIEIYAANSK